MFIERPQYLVYHEFMTDHHYAKSVIYTFTFNRYNKDIFLQDVNMHNSYLCKLLR